MTGAAAAQVRSIPIRLSNTERDVALARRRACIALLCGMALSLFYVKRATGVVLSAMIASLPLGIAIAWAAYPRGEGRRERQSAVGLVIAASVLEEARRRHAREIRLVYSRRE